MSAQPNANDEDVTVAIPTRDPNPGYLKANLDSVLAQTRRPNRIVVVDNSQKDPAAVRDLCESYGAGVIDYFPPARNLSLSENHQRALALCQTPFICVMQDDDVYTPTFVERAIEAFRADEKAVLFAVNYGVIDEQGTIIRERAWPSFRAGTLTTVEFLSYAIELMSPVHLSASMFRREASVSTGFSEADTTCSDIGFFLRVACAGSVILLDEPLAYIREHARSASFDQGWYGKKNSIVISVFPIEWKTKDLFLVSSPAKQALGDQLELLRSRAEKRLIHGYLSVVRGRGYPMHARLACLRNAGMLAASKFARR